MERSHALFFTVFVLLKLLVCAVIAWLVSMDNTSRYIRFKDSSREFNIWLNGLEPDKDEIWRIIAELAKDNGFYEVAAVHVDE